MSRDIRSTSLYGEVEDWFHRLRRPGTGQLSDAAEIHVALDAKTAVFAGTIVDQLEGTPPTRICLHESRERRHARSHLRPQRRSAAEVFPDGTRIAFLSDRHGAGDFQLYLVDSLTGAVRTTCRVEGRVEYFHWSPDGTRILLAVAGHGADIAAGHGAIASQVREERATSWLPQVETGEEAHRWRSVWVYECSTNRVTRSRRPD